MFKRQQEIYAQLRELGLPGEAWALIAELNNMNMMHPDHIKIEAIKAKDRERKRATKEENSTDSTELPIINKEKEKGGMGEKGKTNSTETPTIILKTVLDCERARAVVEHRQKLRKPLTRHGARLLAGALGGAPDPNVAADTMISRGWAGFKVEWLNNSRDPPKANGIDRGPDSWTAKRSEYVKKHGEDAFKVYCAERENK